MDVSDGADSLDASLPTSIANNSDVNNDMSSALSAAGYTSALHSQNQQAETRRHSTRSVKRRKFDDELVESSLSQKQERLRTASKSYSESVINEGNISESSLSASQSSLTVNRTTRSSTAAATAVVTPVVAATEKEKPTAATPVASSSQSKPPEKKKAATKNAGKNKLKKSKKPANSAQVAASKNLGRWKPQDDLLLIEAVQQTSDLKCVHLGVKFSCNFNLKDLEDRWYTLLYNEKVSKLAMTAIQQLPSDEVMKIKAKALFSKAEEDLLSTIKVSSQPSVATFNELLRTNVAKFHPARTGKSLMDHWMLMKQYHLLPDQSVQPLPKGDHILNFSDAEELLDDRQLLEPANELVRREMMINDKKQKKEIKLLEQELPKWQVLVESVTGVSQPEFDSQTLAILRGRLVRYLMRSKEITLGRATKDNQVDVDLTLEGPAYKISRRQGSIKLRNTGEFIITNSGKRPLYVDSKPVLTNGKAKLHHNSVVEITSLRFIFLINQDLIKNMKSDLQKTVQSSSSTALAV